MEYRRRLGTAVVLFAALALPSSSAYSRAAGHGSHLIGIEGASITVKALLHNSWDTAYRSPFGAVPTGTHVVLRFRTAAKNASSVVLYLHTYDQLGKTTGTSHQAMQRTAGRKYDLWQTTVTPSAIGVYTYVFKITQGSQAAWYAPTIGRDGGVGQASTGKKQPDSAYRITAYEPSFAAPSWATKAVIYQIFPDRFYNGDASNDTKVMDPQYDNVHPVIHTNWNDKPLGGSDFFGGDLQGIIDKLPYLKSLGVNTLYLNPIFLAPSNHKYDTSDYFTIDPHFGSLSTLKTLLNAAHTGGMHVILDGVFNHTGSDSIYFNRYGHFSDVGAYQSKASPYYPWYTFQSWPSGYLSFGGYDSLPQLQENDVVKDFIFRKPDSVAQYWLGQGTDGWRLDAAQLKSNQWWQEFRTAVKAKYPDTILIAEDTAGPIDPTPFLMGNEFDGFMNYNFRDAVISFFSQGRIGNGGGTATSFIRNLMAMVQDYPLPAIVSSMNLVDSHDTERILEDVGGKTNELKLVAALQMTWLGAPTIYYGDEAGLTGNTDPDDRRTFPWDHQDTGLEAFYTKLTGIRTANPALEDGSVAPLLADNTHRVVAFLRRDSKQHVVVILNDGASSRKLSIKVPGVPAGTSLKDAMSGKAYTLAAGSKLSVQVPATGVAILVQSASSD